MVLTLVGAAQLECAHAGCSLRALPAGQSFAEASTSTEERRMMEAEVNRRTQSRLPPTCMGNSRIRCWERPCDRLST